MHLIISRCKSVMFNYINFLKEKYENYIFGVINHILKINLKAWSDELSITKEVSLLESTFLCMKVHKKSKKSKYLNLCIISVISSYYRLTDTNHLSYLFVTFFLPPFFVACIIIFKPFFFFNIGIYLC